MTNLIKETIKKETDSHFIPRDSTILAVRLISIPV